MIDVRRLRLLRELDSRGTVHAAALALHLTPSAVSQQLATLAKEVGVPLLEPQGRGVRLTAAARVLLRHADEIFAQLERVEADLAALSRGEAGTVTVAAFPTAITGIVVPAIEALRRSHPGIDLTIIDVDPPGCYDMLVGGELDLAVGFAADHPVSDGRIEALKLLDDLFDVALPADHPLVGLDAVPLAALAGETFVASRQGTACLVILENACRAAGFSPRIRHRCDEFPVVFGLVEANCGVALIPRLAGLSSTDKVVLRPLAERTVRPLVIALRRGSATAPHVAVVLDALLRAAGEVAVAGAGAAGAGAAAAGGAGAADPGGEHAAGRVPATLG
ncbi:MAG: LysR family transcriptional regulator [Frankia sp.]|nr:LysR family transcriptional regulator [Frankia sp.]